MSAYVLDKLKLDQNLFLRMLVESTMAGHRNAKDAKKRLQEYKQKIGKIDLPTYKISIVLLCLEV